MPVLTHFLFGAGTLSAAISAREVDGCLRSLSRFAEPAAYEVECSSFRKTFRTFPQEATRDPVCALLQQYLDELRSERTAPSVSDLEAIVELFDVRSEEWTHHRGRQRVASLGETDVVVLPDRWGTWIRDRVDSLLFDARSSLVVLQAARRAPRVPDLQYFFPGTPTSQREPSPFLALEGWWCRTLGERGTPAATRMLVRRRDASATRYWFDDAPDARPRAWLSEEPGAWLVLQQWSADWTGGGAPPVFDSVRVEAKVGHHLDVSVAHAVRMELAALVPLGVRPGAGLLDRRTEPEVLAQLTSVQQLPSAFRDLVRLEERGNAASAPTRVQLARVAGWSLVTFGSAILALAARRHRISRGSSP